MPQVLTYSWQNRVTYDYVKDFIGKPYIWGGEGPDGFDCSGLVIEIMQSCGVLPHRFDTTAQGLYKKFLVSGKQVRHQRFGTLVFYGKSKERITHVSIAIDESRVIDAGGGNSKTTTLEEAAKVGAMVRMRPTDYRRDRVAMLHPTSSYFP